jgi:nicotinamide mononucleotide adenylyltransferase
MQQTIQTHGLYFIASHQYEYTGTIQTAIDISLPRLKNNGRQAKHYIVPVEDREYYIPECVCVEYDVVMTAEQQNKTLAHENEVLDNTKDWVPVWEKVSGIPIKRDASADIDLRKYNSLKEEMKGKK